MRIQKLFGLSGSRQATGLTVIIDVFRAATVCAFLLDKGVRSVIPVSTKEEAFLYQKRNASAILIGEENGIIIESFHFGNSPLAINRANNLHGKTVIHRTSQGTQGIVNAINAREILFSSFVTASATARYITYNAPDVVSIVAMDGAYSEDDVYADYLISLIKGTQPKSMTEITYYLRNHPKLTHFHDPTKTSFPLEDFYFGLDVDRFNFTCLLRNGSIVKNIPPEGCDGFSRQHKS